MQSQRLNITQTQKMKMSPQLYQSIQLMSLPLTELQQKVKEEIEKNPALDGLAQKNEVPSGDLNSQSEDWDPFENSSDPGYKAPAVSSFTGDEDSKRKFLEGAVSRGESLHEHLLEQVRLHKLSKRELEIAEKVIYNLDENGFHRENPELLIDEGEEPLLEKLITKIQHLEPQGCATPGFLESLMAQASYREDAPLDTEIFIEQKLMEYKENKKEKISREMGIEPDELDNILDFLKTLTPYPGRLYSSEPTQFVVPDLNIRYEEGEFRIFLNDSQIPELKVDDYFDELSHDKALDKEARSFASTHVKDARWFINSIEQRNKTLLKTAHAIVQFQKEFFRSGPRHLAPLTLKDVASEIGVHEATVSRITTNKYVQTEWGILELKYFFTNSISGAGSSGSSYSKESVKLIIKEIIEEYTGEKRLSDQKISDMLAQKGISLARRTVTKYRKELDIDSSFHR